MLCLLPVVFADWLNLPKWNDGLAEVCLYEGKALRYGVLRDSTLDLITVREHFAVDKLVKTRPARGKDVLPVMKMNMTKKIRTGVYEYVQMGSVFIDRNQGRLLKLSCVSSEWCGNSFALFKREGPKATLEVSNYMDDRGSSNWVIAQPETLLFYDELILYLRQHLHRIKSGQSIRVASTLLSNNPEHQVHESVIQRVDWVRDRDSVSLNRVEIELEFKGIQERFIFSDKPMRRLLEWHNSRGEYYKLRKSMFLDYWNKNKPGDEKLLCLR